MNLSDFVNPPRQCRPLLVWSWNGTVDVTEVENHIRDMKRKGFGGFIIRPAQGLRIPYLSDEWMRVVRRAVETARDQEIEAWLSDDERGPSGYAGGKTTEGRDGNLAMALVWTDDAASLGPDDLAGVVAFTRRDENGEMLSFPEQPDDPAALGAFYECRLSRGARFNGGGYPDLLNPDTVREFIEITHERYSKLFRYDFGRFMPGIFTCGPTVSRQGGYAPENTVPGRAFPWTADFADYFERIHGYSPAPHLHHLLGGSGGFSFRHDFWRTITERFIESFSISLAEWCHERDYLFAGSFPRDGFAGILQSGASAMAHAEYLDVPAVECSPDSSGTVRAIREAASVANQLGKKRVVGKLFGTKGDAPGFAEMKWIADQAVALGVTSIAPCASPYSLAGSGKRDIPRDFSNRQPFWEYARVLSDYLARVSWAVSRGVSAAETLVLHPLGSAYGVYESAGDGGSEAIRTLEDSFDTLLEELLAGHVSFDLGDERILIAHGKSDGDVFIVGKMRYRTVIIPRAYTWLAPTLDLLESFTGTIFVLGGLPGRVNGVANDRFERFVQRPNVTVLPDESTALPALLAGGIGSPVRITRPDGGAARSVLMNHRREAGAHILFLANTNRTASEEVRIELDALGGVVELDPRTGRGYRYASERDGDMTVIRTTLDPSGSRIFVVDQTQTSVEERPCAALTETAFEIAGPFSFTRRDDNILVLDHCTLEMDGGVVLENAPVGEVRETIGERTGIAGYNGCQPWVLEARNVRTRTNTTTLTFEFNVRDIPEKLELAVESAERFVVEVNGKRVETSAGKWHVDRDFHVFVITGSVIKGRNVIRMTTDFLWDTAIENMYLAGSFALGSGENGYLLTAEPEVLGTGDWVRHGYPFYSGTMTYRLSFTLDSVGPHRYELDLSGAEGSLFAVTVNGTEVGALAFPPFRGDISGALRPGNNTVEIEVIGSLNSVLQPAREEHGTFPIYGLIAEPKLFRIG